MRLVIDDKDFRCLPPEVQTALFKQLSGRELPKPKRRAAQASYGWKEPIDLNHDLTVKLMHGLGKDHRQRLHYLAEHGGRATMKELLKLTRDTDWHVLSYFQTVVTRKLRRILNDDEKRAFLIGWDYGAVKWNQDRTEILDGVYYVSDASARCLHEHFHTR